MSAIGRKRNGGFRTRRSACGTTVGGGKQTFVRYPHGGRGEGELISLLALASISRCASLALCPTDDQLRSAVSAHDSAVVQAVSDQAAKADPDSIFMIHTQRIKRIADVLCGDKLPSNLTSGPPVIHCKFTVKYWSSDDFQVARLVQRDGRWDIDETLVVTRDRR